MFKTMKVATKLGLGFGFLLLLMVTIIVIGLTKMSGMNESVEVLVKDRYQKTVLVNAAIRDSFDNGRSLRNLLLVDSEADIEKNKQKIQTNRGKIKENLDKLDKMIKTAKGRELFNAIDKEDKVLEPMYDELFGLVKSNPKQAKDFLLKNFAPANTAYVATLQEMADFQGSQMEKESEADAEAYVSTRNMVVGFGIIAVLAGMALSFLITRSLTRALGCEPATAAEIANKIAAGDLSSKIEIKAGDNSSLIYSMNAMQDSLTRIVAEIRQIVAEANKGEFSTKMELNSKAGYAKE